MLELYSLIVTLTADVFLFQDVFTLIINLFEDLADTASPFFSKRVKVLEIMAQLKCCVIMLEINCLDLVLEMFNIFFSVVRLNLRSISSLFVLGRFTVFLGLLSNWGKIVLAYFSFTKGLCIRTLLGF